MFSSFYSYSNNTNLSKTPQEYYCPPSSSSSSFQLLSPHYITFEDGTISNELLQQENMIISDDHSIHNTNNIANIHEQVSSLQSDIRKCNINNGVGHDDGFNKTKKSSTKGRSSNDRHSKINTAHGPRDRRMRLSLDVAKRFFKLQDMLGFEKASNTIEWLLMKSEPNIQELLSFKGISNSTASSTSQYELWSENIEEGQSAKSFSSSNQKQKRKSSSGLRKSSYLFRPFAKETREMARKRARERTVEKSSKLGCANDGEDQFSKVRPCLDQPIYQDVNRFGSWIINPPEQLSTQFQSKQGIMAGGNCSLMTGNWNPSFLLNNQLSGVLSQEHDFQMIGNFWEGNI